MESTISVVVFEDRLLSLVPCTYPAISGVIHIISVPMRKSCINPIIDCMRCSKSFKTFQPSNLLVATKAIYKKIAAAVEDIEKVTLVQ